MSAKMTASKNQTKTSANKKKAATNKSSNKKIIARKKNDSPKKLAVIKTLDNQKTTTKKKSARAKKPVRQRAVRNKLLSGPLHGITPYVAKHGEEYMNQKQLKHFEAILTSWKNELMNESNRTVHHMQDEASNFPDPNDRATQESEFSLELRTRDRERKLLSKIENALTRIKDSSYGFCEETDEAIGLKRLEARPVATLCLEAQERRELAERQFRDLDDRYR
jgi:DnaK suppressor protein